MLKEYNRKLVLESGEEFYGYAFGAECEKVCELVFNTSMVGYQEILSDPSYTYQAVVMTYPLIGNYGMAADDYETAAPTLGAFVVGEYNDKPSNFRSEKTLAEVMKEYNIPGICGVDTRALTRKIRDIGSEKVLITNVKTSREEALAVLREAKIPTDAVKTVSRKKTEEYLVENSHFHIVAIDCGMKQNIVRSLNSRGCSVTVVPYNTSANVIETLNPDGIFISNGPGDPADVPEVSETIKELRGKYPVFGICLGHQLICISYGGSCFKLKFGHRGGNHPIKNLETEKIEITSQNHSYAVDPKTLENTPLNITHINLLDNTVEGVRCERDKVFSVQYHPESAPGPEDSGYLFDEFIKLLEEGKKNA